MQPCVNEIAQHKLMLTPGSIVSLLFFFPLHGMCRRNQEKHPANIVVRSQRKEQGVIGLFQGAVTVKLRPAIYKVGFWDTCRKSRSGPRCITPYRGSMSKVMGLGEITALVWHMLGSESIGCPYWIVDLHEIWQYGEKFRNTVIAISFLTAKTWRLMIYLR